MNLRKTSRLADLGATGILLAETVIGSYWDLARISSVREVFRRLEYPMYFATIMGVAKAAAVAAIVTPGFPRAEEWAYAGLTFVYGIEQRFTHIGMVMGMVAMIGFMLILIYNLENPFHHGLGADSEPFKRLFE